MRQEKQMKFDSLSDRLGTGNVDGADCHFAFRTDDFDGVLAALSANGFREDAAEDGPMQSLFAVTAPPLSPVLPARSRLQHRRDQRRTVAMPSACRADANATCVEKVASFGRTSAVPLLSKACAGLRHTARLGAKYPTRPSSKLVASSPDNIFATADFHDFH
jgi:hypothetical protein